MPVVLSDGRSVAIRRSEMLTSPSLAIAAGGGSIDLLRSDADYSVTYEYVYRSQPFVFATINKLAYSAARNPLWFYQEDPDSETLERVRRHDAVRLMRKPAPRMSQFRWLGEAFRSLYVHGHHLVWKDRVAGTGTRVKHLWPIPWTHVRVTQDDLGPVAYDITINGTTYQLSPQEVMHFQLLGGRSPLEVLRASVAMEDAAQLYQAYSLRNGVSPRALFSGSNMNARAVDVLRAELRKLYAGPENAGNFVVANGDLNVKTIGVSPADLGLMPMREFARQEVLSALDVPPPLIGLMENATLANVLEYRKAMHEAVKGKLIMVEQDIQVQLIDDEPAWDGLISEINTDAWQLPDPETRAKMHMLNQQASVNTINERRRSEKLAPIDDPIADTVFVPMNMAPVGVDLAESVAGTPAQGIADRIVSDTLAE
jgi:HK97 family phage portal protein